MSDSSVVRTADAIDPRWFETFFSGLALDFWRAAVPAEQTRVEVDFLAKALQLPPGARVLDIACGLGRHSLELAARGHRPIGVDASREALEQARAEAAARQLAVEFAPVDLRELSACSAAAGPFDGAFALGNSFGYVDPSATRGYLAGVARALKRGARFVLDSGYVAESLLPHLREREWLAIGDFLFLEENRYLVDHGCVETTYTFLRGGESLTRKGYQWVFTLRELRELLHAAGFDVEAQLQSTDGTPYAWGARYLLLVARKR
ncbi:MAG: class I SAM-dependent methyltransferase [Planctomycetes bacterium]|nr:class I SAM-dependent methyltransferase [Planctomycetota bacterium]